MYHFVNIEGTWYLKPESIQDILDHYHQILKCEFEAGIKDRIDNTHVLKNGYVYHAHEQTTWNCAVTMLAEIKGKSWALAADELEKQTLNDRINLFNKGRFIALSQGLPYYASMEIPQFKDELWIKELTYPTNPIYDYNKARYIKWPRGKHWYAKIGNVDIVDSFGNQKWDTKEEAIEAAKYFCSCQKFNKTIFSNYKEPQA